MNKRDPKGFYRILGVAPNATAAEIKIAFRRRAKVLHPDHNDARDASAQFQMLNAAYEALKDPSSRARYDTIAFKTAATAHTEQQHSAEPIVCSCCGKVSAQPRYVIFFTLKSFVLITLRNTIQGIFCSACAEKQSYKASALSLLLGWWSFPWGPIFTVHAIIANMMGGKHPPEVNARIAMHQAWYFATLGNVDLARAVAMDALDLAGKAPSTPEGAALRGDAEKFVQIIGGTTQRLKNTWQLLSRPFFVQAATIAAIVIGIALLYVMPPPGPKTYAVAAPVQAAAPATRQSGYVRPATTPNGLPWPVKADYLPGTPLFNTDGDASITVDNSRNDADVFVKLVSSDGENASAVRQFFIPAGRSFTLGSIRQGIYEIRYKDLNSGVRFRSDTFTLTDSRTSSAIGHSRATLTLYKSSHIALPAETAADEDF
ncbi:J domain-containing protein [Bradyrhizobium sp. 2TAF24]|uniref:J domain-containing protein n=1 Tax=Bradyrhizobium sp. 2TAF24 TaxID=3233011 RepID=UPI003F8DED50